jgi:hypothetical protein
VLDRCWPEKAKEKGIVCPISLKIAQLIQEGVITGKHLALDSCSIKANVKENNLKASAQNRFDKTRQLPGDPDAADTYMADLEAWLRDWEGFVKEKNWADFTWYIHGFDDEFGWEGELDDYIAGGVDLKFFNDVLLLRLFTVYDMTDTSAILFPQLILTKWDSTEMQLGALFNFGDDDTKFGQKASGRNLVFTKIKVSY